MCVKGGKVIWIDGLSINPKQLSQEIEPVGIYVVINGNKAMVRYRKEEKMRWAASERWELPYVYIMNDNASYSLRITLDGTTYDNLFTYTAPTRASFVGKLNNWFKANNSNYSAELVEPNTDLPAKDTSDKIIDTNPIKFKNRIIINAKFTNWSRNKINIEQIGEGTSAIAKHLDVIKWYYRNNGFKRNVLNSTSGCCYARYYENSRVNGTISSSPMKSIDSSNPINEDAFNGANCQILRENFASYNEYIDSMMVKYRCGKDSDIINAQSGKENTYKLANCTFIDNTITSGTRIKPLYPAAHYAASINIDAPGLEEGNWWLPSAAEMVQMMRDITYDTDSWDSENIDNNTDIVNRVLFKLNSFDSVNWTMLSAVKDGYWTSSKCDEFYICLYNSTTGGLSFTSLLYIIKASPITIYEF